MSNTTLLLSFCLVLVGIFMAYREIMPRWEKRQTEKAGRERTAAEKQSALIDAMLSLSKSMGAVAAQGDDNKLLLAGTVKACEAIAQSTVSLRDEVSSFAKLIAAPKAESDYPDDQILKPNTEEEAALAQDTFQRVLQRGIPLDQAVQEAKEAAEKKMMFATANLEDGE